MLTIMYSNCLKITFCQLTYRNVCTTSVLNGSQNGRFMKKVLHENKSRRKWQINQPSLSKTAVLTTNLTKGISEGKRSTNHRRVTVLNKLFMKYITDIMASGTNSSEFLGKGIEISRVMVAPDFNGVNVFWVTKGDETDAVVEATLAQNAGAIRHELSQLRVMGVVPQIYFVKDKEHAKIVELDARLARADFGEDYQPIRTNYSLRTDFCLNTTLPESIKEKISDLEKNEWEEIEEPLPPMRMDVLGLNHSGIMLKVQQGIKKSRAPHRSTILPHGASEEYSLSSKINDNAVEFESHKKQKEAFSQFLLKRQILQLKALKKKSKYDPTDEFFRSELPIYLKTPFAEELKEGENDYIEEEEDI